jgi:hypothetical protein
MAGLVKYEIGDTVYAVLSNHPIVIYGPGVVVSVAETTEGRVYGIRFGTCVLHLTIAALCDSISAAAAKVKIALVAGCGI